MRKKIFYCPTGFALALGLVLLVSHGGLAKAGAIVEGNGQDGFVTLGVVNNGAYSSVYNFAVGALYGTDSACAVEAFALPYLAPGQQVTAASISFYLESLDGAPTYKLQLYGLNRVSTTSPVPIVTDWYTGTNDTLNTLLDPTLITPSSPTQQAATYSGSSLLSFVQKQYANAAFTGLDLSPTRYIFFRVSPDGTQNGFNNYVVGNSRNPNRAEHPVLSLTISNGLSNVAGRLQFSFNLPQASITSAGVYNPTTGALIRTIWNNVQYQAGMNYGAWDGNDDLGNPVATGTPYQIKLIYHNVQYVWEGMIGNTSASQSGANVYHSFGKMQDMSISGTQAFYTVGYNENENPFHGFTVGSPQVPNEINLGFTDPNSNFSFMTSDGTRNYWAKGYGGMNANNTYIIAMNNSNGSLYTFPKGTTPTGGGTSYFYTSCIDFDATANQANAASGLAVQKSGTIFLSAMPISTSCAFLTRCREPCSAPFR